MSLKDGYGCSPRQRLMLFRLETGTVQGWVEYSPRMGSDTHQRWGQIFLRSGSNTIQGVEGWRVILTRMKNDNTGPALKTHNIDVESTLNRRYFNIVCLLGRHEDFLPSRHTALQQRRFNIDSTLWWWINVESTLSQRCVPPWYRFLYRTCVEKYSLSGLEVYL